MIKKERQDCQARLIKHKHFSKSAKGYPGQSALFNEVEQLLNQLEAESTEADKA